jgi:hypothetical protein
MRVSRILVCSCRFSSSQVGCGPFAITALRELLLGTVRLKVYEGRATVAEAEEEEQIGADSVLG